MIDVELSWTHPDPDGGDSHAAAHRYIASRGTRGADRTLFAIAPGRGGSRIRVRTRDPGLLAQITQADTYLRSIEPPSVAPGMTYHFLLTANAAEHRTGGRVEPVIDETAAMAWLDHKANAGGFAVDAEAIVLPSLEVPRRDGQDARLHRVRFAGTLRIIEELSFSNVLSAGIGRGKAFGLGMLILLAEDH